MKRKLKLGALVRARRSGRSTRMRRLRGTTLDPFGLRRACAGSSGELIGEYEELVGEALARLDAGDPRRRALELLELPDVIRGYEEIKLRNVALFRKRAAAAAQAPQAPARCVVSGA